MIVNMLARLLCRRPGAKTLCKRRHSEEGLATNFRVERLDPQRSDASLGM